MYTLQLSNRPSEPINTQPCLLNIVEFYGNVGAEGMIWLKKLPLNCGIVIISEAVNV